MPQSSHEIRLDSGSVSPSQRRVWPMCWSDYPLAPERRNPEVTGTPLWGYSWRHTLRLLKFRSRWASVKLSAVDAVPEQRQHRCNFSFSVLCRVGSHSWQEFLHCCLRNESFQPWREKQSGIFKLRLSAVPFSPEVHLVNLRRLAARMPFLVLTNVIFINNTRASLF